MINIVKFIAFWISMGGYVALLKRKARVETAFTPIMVVTSIGSIVFLAGLLNIMSITFWLIFVGGIILAGWYIKDAHKNLKISIGIIVTILLICYLYVFLSDVKYYHYDNFTHWGVVVKSIFENSRFPNFEDQLITYQAYPLGSAGFIWYVCKVIGYTEGNTLFAQSILYVCSASCLFAFPEIIEDKKKKFVGYVIALCMSLVMITYGHTLANGLFQLLVDVLLALVALAAMVIVMFYRDNALKAAVCVLPLVVFEVCIKNSGIMWVATIIIAIFVFCNKSIKIKEISKIIGLVFGVPMIFWVLWNKHTELVFSAGNTSSHSMSAENYNKIFTSKTSEDIATITQLFIGEIFSTNNKIWFVFIVFCLILLGLLFFNKKLLRKTRGVEVFFFLTLVYLIYQIGNYVMYLFSMPVQEALYLAGYARYAMTIELFIWGGVLIYIFLLLIENSGKVLVLGLLLVSVFLLHYESRDIKTLVKYEPPTSGRETARDHLEAIIEEYQLSEGKKSLIYIGGPPDRDVGYRSWLSKYMLYSNDIKTITANEISELENFENYDYVIILEPDKTYENWMADADLPVDFGECFVKDEHYIKFVDYMEKLENEQYIVLISVKDDASVSFTSEMKDAMQEVGLMYDLTNQYRSSYVAVMDGGTVVYEELSQEKIEYSSEVAGLKLEIVSAGMSSGNVSKIEIDDVEYSPNNRGINIVIYDKASKTVCEQITFDTWLTDGAYLD